MTRIRATAADTLVIVLAKSDYGLFGAAIVNIVERNFGDTGFKQGCADRQPGTPRANHRHPPPVRRPSSLIEPLDKSLAIEKVGIPTPRGPAQDI